MSAGIDLPIGAGVLTVQRSLGLLAPKMREAVEAGVAECQRLALNVEVYETYRSDALQKVYYARGRTVRPPDYTVTNARSNLDSWHGLGLAIDVIHAKKRWSMPASWFRAVAAVLIRYNLDWGGEWSSPDYPHFQWGYCRRSPSQRARDLYARGGLEAVWREVGAMGVDPLTTRHAPTTAEGDE